MTNNRFTPIYTAQELADLVTKHDEEHPDHGHDCTCENGMISTLRIYFTPDEPAAKTVNLYVPPEIKREMSEPPSDANTRQPWLARQGNETRREYDWRILHSCYNCGTVIADMTDLALHEDRCGSQGKQRDK